MKVRRGSPLGRRAAAQGLIFSEGDRGQRREPGTGLTESAPEAAAGTAANAGAGTGLGGPGLERAGLGNKTGADWLEFVYAPQ